MTCQAQSALGGVYKIVEFQGTARMKFSEETEKVTLPGSKVAVRIFIAGSERPHFDMLCLKLEADLILKKQMEITYYTKKALGDEA